MITDDYDDPTIAELDDANRMLTEIQGASVAETGEVPDWTYTAKYVLLEELERRTEDDRKLNFPAKKWRDLKDALLEGRP